MLRSRFVIVATAIALITACASRPAVQQTAPAPATQPVLSLPHYRCDHDISFTVRFGDDTAEIDVGTRGKEMLLRDAGGVTPQQTVYSSTKAKAEFGLDPQGDGAKLHFADPPLELTCVRDGASTSAR